MKKNGFITTALLYGMLSLFIVLMLSSLAILANRKINMDNLREAAIRKSAIDNVEMPTISEELISKSDDEKKQEGLFEEKLDENTRYVYKGIDPKNYIWFNEELWRIMVIESDGVLKIIKKELIITGEPYDINGNRSSSYCFSAVQGCNIWGSRTNLYDRELNQITQIPLVFGQTDMLELPDRDCTMNVYLNTTYYNQTLRDAAKEFMVSGFFNVGPIVRNNEGNQTLNQDFQQVSSIKWKGNVGLIDVTEYVRASAANNCNSFNDGGFFDANGAACRNENYLYVPTRENGDGNFWQTLTPESGSSNRVYSLRGGEDGNDGYLASVYSRLGSSIRPTVYLRSDIRVVDGDGSEDNPYKIEIIE